jgi:hypothetical protein
MCTKKIFQAFGVSILILFLHSCYYDKADLLYPASVTGCDSANATYNLKIIPILSQQCYSCHTGSSAGGGIVMGTYATDQVIAVNGKLYGVINHSSGFSPMPKGGSQMSVCDIATIKKWIDSGSPNN